MFGGKSIHILGSVRKINLHNFQVATSETVRDINSRIMLNLVREHQLVSRADLMRYSGLQRSTVSAITGQLLADRWLKAGAVGHRRASFNLATTRIFPTDPEAKPRLRGAIALVLQKHLDVPVIG